MTSTKFPLAAEGYALIADCLDDPGPASRIAGERYMKENRASTLRRFVERHCGRPLTGRESLVTTRW
jgi:hypothetical protein